MDHKLIGSVSVHHSRSQMSMVNVMTITIDSLLPRPKLDCDSGYDVAVKGPSVVVACWYFLTYVKEYASIRIYHPSTSPKSI
jgi:hypothetical protein